MLFPTTDFALFFAVVFALHWTLHRFHTVWKWFILAASYVFYGWWDPGLGGLLAPAGGVQVPRFLRAEHRQRVRVVRPAAAAAPPPGPAADRDLVLHVHGDQLRGRCLALRDPAGALAGRRRVPLALPAPGRRPDRPRGGTDPAEPATPRRERDRPVARRVLDLRRSLQ